jgi:hypothetical protein
MKRHSSPGSIGCVDFGGETTRYVEASWRMLHSTLIFKDDLSGKNLNIQVVMKRHPSLGSIGRADFGICGKL